MLLVFWKLFFWGTLDPTLPEKHSGIKSPGGGGGGSPVAHRLLHVFSKFFVLCSISSINCLHSPFLLHSGNLCFLPLFHEVKLGKIQHHLVLSSSLRCCNYDSIRHNIRKKHLRHQCVIEYSFLHFY